MNLAGSIPKSYLNTSLPQTDWIAQGSSMVIDNSTDTLQKMDTKQILSTVEKEPKDNVQFVELERAKGSKPGLGTLFE